jgi:hypothetical protein
VNADRCGLRQKFSAPIQGLFQFNSVSGAADFDGTQTDQMIGDELRVKQLKPAIA